MLGMYNAIPHVDNTGFGALALQERVYTCRYIPVNAKCILISDFHHVCKDRHFTPLRTCLPALRRPVPTSTSSVKALWQSNRHAQQWHLADGMPFGQDCPEHPALKCKQVVL